MILSLKCHVVISLSFSFLSIEKGYSLNYSKKIIEDLIEQIIQNIGLGNLILKNLGSFKLLKKAERLGRNPKNGKIYKISARKTVKFMHFTLLSNLRSELIIFGQNISIYTA